MRNEKACVSDPNQFFTCPGSTVRVEYSAKVKPDGSIELVPSGKFDIKEFINSFRDSTDMSYILSRLAVGDKSVLNQKSPVFGDFTSMPKTYAESLQLVMDAKEKFYQLPVELRNKFDNDFNKWFVTAGSDFWIKSMGFDKSLNSQVSNDSTGDSVDSDERRVN